MLYGYISRETNRTVGKTSVTNDAISHILSARNDKQDEQIRLTRSILQRSISYHKQETISIFINKTPTIFLKLHEEKSQQSGANVYLISLFFLSNPNVAIHRPSLNQPNQAAVVGGDLTSSSVVQKETSFSSLPQCPCSKIERGRGWGGTVAVASRFGRRPMMAAVAVCER
jgi:hypothetical protein